MSVASLSLVYFVKNVTYFLLNLVLVQDVHFSEHIHHTALLDVDNLFLKHLKNPKKEHLYFILQQCVIETFKNNVRFKWDFTIISYFLRTFYTFALKFDLDMGQNIY